MWVMIMTIKRYKREEMKSLINDILSAKCEVLPIGNHELKRHQVYMVNTDTDKYVFKYYYRENACNNEIYSLKLLENTEIPAPKLIDHGMIGESNEWILLSFIKGVPYSKHFRSIDEQSKQSIFFKLGEMLSSIHLIPIEEVTYAGEQNYRVALEKSINGYVSDIKKLKKEVPIVHRALKFLKESISMFDTSTDSCFCHRDYDGRNVLILRDDDGWHVNGILDYEKSMYWDRSYDFTFMFINHFYEHPEYIKFFIEGYRKKLELPDNIDDHLKFYMVYDCLKALTWCKDISPEYFAKCQNIIQDIIFGDYSPNMTDYCNYVK